MFVHLGDELRLIQKCGECASQIHLHGQVCPCCAAELVGHFIGFTVTLGCFKVDGCKVPHLFPCFRETKIIQKRVMQNIEIRLITRKFIDFNENECF